MNRQIIEADLPLRARASKVIPGGMWGHQNAARLPEGYPQYFSRARGCRTWDANGRGYIDFMCAWGPMILGYNDPDVEAAAARQRELGDGMNGPSARLVELAELFVATVPHADWAMFSKNGTDATTACVTIARAGTGRRKILLARGAYHGAIPWCTPSVAGVTEEDRAHLIYYDYNDVESLETAVQQAGGDLAAILASAFKHDLGKEHVLPTVEFARRARSLATKADAALILDDVRAGLRLHLGGSWETVGVKPDLAAWSKAVANGHALAAVTGNDRFREAATRIFTTGSFWTAAVSMAASIATINKLRDTGGVERMRAVGQRLRDGLDRQAVRHGMRLKQSGPVQMPVFLFEDDADLKIGNRFCLEALARGVYIHPTHTMFLSAAHTDADIDEALAATDEAMSIVAKL
ncbi:aminotransferase class III-fold pyridoxal phosphate-dependent enzyme [Aquamicrobium sp. LC103]|uniref:aminotransferase class III-fold pyridoxal phosphate-dependent enzyme n=1 Tax=Aquamicrobium sp. LC103 TaxID=1120658 RepID=UPI00063EC9DE|nr:aminotransferase class III-fold pyridoxal phosphate-dependent enzyme [Aquamicrobium sp. LC103]TKT69292.1 aminotransferase class III-fold pyridoxal phosphate-dependent enzyme [Aquamicrobium sp. LC103]